MAQLFSLEKLISASRCSIIDDSLYYSIDTEVNLLWAEYNEEAARRGECLQSEHMGAFTFRDGPTALTIAFFASARIILSLAGPRECSRPARTMEAQCQTILNCTMYLFEQRKFTGCASLPMILPLTLVAHYGTTPQHRKTASLFLKDRSSGFGFNGIRAIASHHIHSTDIHGLFKGQRVRHEAVSH